MPKIKQPHFESLQRYTQEVLVTHSGDYYLVERDNVLPVDEAIIVSMKPVGYRTFPNMRLKGNIYLCRIIATNEILDWMNYTA